jgi:hypothetical protein
MTVKPANYNYVIIDPLRARLLVNPPERALPEKSYSRLLLCAISVCSVPLWLFLLRKSEPQSRHRELRGCTEQSYMATFGQSLRKVQTQRLSK